MSRADYAHWNEEQDLVWWAEEGRHQGDPNEGPDWDDDSSWDDDYDDYDDDES